MDKTQIKDVVSGQLRKIGNYLSLRPEIDNNFKVTNLIRSNLSTVDIIPVDFALRFSYVADKAQNSYGNNYAISYDFDTPTNNYRKKCEDYDLQPYDGIQLWLTDDTQAYEEFTNSFANNMIETGVNNVSENTGQRLQAFTQSFGVGAQQGSRFFEAGKQFIEDVFNHLPGNFGKEAANIAGTVADVVIRGKQISLPKIWRQSDYNPSISFNVKLISPYGDPEAIKHYIIAPLTYILLMIAPESGDGLTYGLYQPVKIKAYGIYNINLGAITSVSLRRGGRETAYNAYKQPLQIDVGVNCIPLTSGFAYLTGLKDIATMNDASVPYEENAAGSPAITTVGNVIQSLRPAPSEIVNFTSPNSVMGSTSAQDNYSSQFSQRRLAKEQATASLLDHVKAQLGSSIERVFGS